MIKNIFSDYILGFDMLDYIENNNEIINNIDKKKQKIIYSYFNNIHNYEVIELRKKESIFDLIRYRSMLNNFNDLDNEYIEYIKINIKIFRKFHETIKKEETINKYKLCLCFHYLFKKYDFKIAYNIIKKYLILYNIMFFRDFILYYESIRKYLYIVSDYKFNNIIKDLNYILEQEYNYNIFMKEYNFEYICPCGYSFSISDINQHKNLQKHILYNNSIDEN